MATFTFHLDSKVRKQVEKVAKDEDRSLSSVIRRAIMADLDRRQQEATAA